MDSLLVSLLADVLDIVFYVIDQLQLHQLKLVAHLTFRFEVHVVEEERYVPLHENAVLAELPQLHQVV